MENTYSIIIEYFNGRKKGQIVTISLIQDETILDVLGEITREQLANSEIYVLKSDGKLFLYEEFIIEYYFQSKTSLKTPKS